MNTTSLNNVEDLTMMLRLLQKKDPPIVVLLQSIAQTKKAVESAGVLAQGESAQEHAEAVSALQSHLQAYEIMINDRIFSSRDIVRLLLSQSV